MKAFAAVVLGLSALSVQAQTFTYTTGDLIAAFHRTGSPDLEVNLGAVSTFKNAAADLDLSRFDLKYSIGTLPHENLMRCIELYATEVAPRVRAAFEGKS